MGVIEIEEAIKVLPASEVATLTEWVVDYHHRLWDTQIEQDLEAGKLDKLLAEVEAEYQAGLSSPL